MSAPETPLDRRTTVNERYRCPQCESSWSGPGPLPNTCPRCLALGELWPFDAKERQCARGRDEGRKN